MTRLSVLFIIILLESLCSCRRNLPDPYEFLYRGIPNIQTTEAIQIASTDTTGGNNDRYSLQPGEEIEIVKKEGSGFLTRLWFTFDSRDPNYLRNILIKVNYEDESVPAILSPIGDFFGCAFQYKHWTSEYMGMSSGGFYSYWPMPFHEKISITIINDSKYPLYALYFHANLNMFRKARNKKLPYFHAHWQRTTTIPNTTAYEALNIEGQGLFVGLHYNAQGLGDGLGYLEGDESIYVDQKLVVAGTGMEDYLNSGWYFKTGEYAAHHHGLILKEDSLARISAYRYHIKDAIPFKESLRFALEHGNQNDSYADIGTVAFWYDQSPGGYRDSILSFGQRNHYRRMIPYDQNYEIEDITDTSAITCRLINTVQNGVDWNNHDYLEIEVLDQSPITLNINELEESRYNVHLYGTGHQEYDEFRIGNTIIKGNKEKLTPLDPVQIDQVQTNNGRLTIEIEPVNIPSKIGLDFVHLIPDRQYIPTWHFVGPFANPRRSDTERFGLDSVYSPETKPFNANDQFYGINNQSLSWQVIDGKTGGYGMSLWQYIDPYEFVICYAHIYVYAPETKTYDLMIGSDDGIKIFLNGIPVHRFLEVRIAAPDQTRLSVQLEKGRNDLLLKLENNFGGYAFYARFIDPGMELVYGLE